MVGRECECKGNGERERVWEGTATLGKGWKGIGEWVGEGKGTWVAGNG